MDYRPVVGRGLDPVAADDQDDGAGKEGEVEEPVEDGVHDVAARGPTGEVEEVAGEAHGDRLRERLGAVADGVGEVDGAEDDAGPQGDLALAQPVVTPMPRYMPSSPQPTNWVATTAPARNRWSFSTRDA